MYMDVLASVLIDLFTARKQVRYYGIHMYTGIYGSGKTIAMTERLEQIRKKTPTIEIFTNYAYKHETAPLEHWTQLLVESDKPRIFAYDEIQNDFESRAYHKFPKELLPVLTQNRKGAGLQILCTAQNYERVDKLIRELCATVNVCSTWGGRLTSVRTYDGLTYQDWLNKTEENKLKLTKTLYRFHQTDELRNLYDTFARVRKINDIK